MSVCIAIIWETEEASKGKQETNFDYPFEQTF